MLSQLDIKQIRSVATEVRAHYGANASRAHAYMLEFLGAFIDSRFPDEEGAGSPESDEMTVNAIAVVSEVFPDFNSWASERWETRDVPF